MKVTEHWSPGNRSPLLETWRFSWPIFDVLIGGQSSIDLQELQIKNIQNATEFLCNYGYDPRLDRDLRKMQAVFVEAVALISRLLLTDRDRRRGVVLPNAFQRCQDPRELLLWASDETSPNEVRQAWACAILRVMHTIAHIEGVTRYASLEDARRQIMTRFEQRIFRPSQSTPEDGRLWLGRDERRVPLELVEWKYQKTRTSIILKLLHKKDNVAETLYDLIGVRLIVPTKSDAMLALKYLQELDIIMFSNCYPARSRNTLVDPKEFKKQLGALRKRFGKGELTSAEFEQLRISIASKPGPNQSANPHSSRAYRSIQLTCRQLIRVADPRLGLMQKINRYHSQNGANQSIKSGDDHRIDTYRQMHERNANHPSSEQYGSTLAELSNLMANWHSLQEDMELTTFYPFEVQILDREAYSQIKSGAANHDRYKKSQVRSARKRVLGRVLKLMATS